MSAGLYPWHEPLLERAARLIQAGRLPHALLLRGRRGDGLLQAAQALAHLCLCVRPVGVTPCGECKSCQLLAVNSHPDLQLLQPEEPSRIIKIDAVRELVNQFAHTPQIAAWKVAILYPANQLNTAAANALLKTLEEPPGQSLLILAADQHACIMPTLQSRCQQLELARPDHRQATAWLAAQNVQEGEELLQATAGEPLRALAWHEQNRLADWQGFRTLLARLGEADVSLAQATSTLADIPPTDLLHWYMNFLREQLHLSLGSPEASRGFLACFDQAMDAAGELERGTNPNQQLMTESLLMQWQRICATGRQRAVG